MAVQSKQLQSSSVQEEPVEFESCIAQSDADTVIVDGSAVDEQRGDHVVEMWRIDVPEFHVAEIRQRELHFLLARFVNLDQLTGAGDNARVIAQFNPQLKYSSGNRGSIECAQHIDMPARIEHLHRLSEHIANEDLRHGLEPHRPINAACFEIVKAPRTFW